MEIIGVHQLCSMYFAFIKQIFREKWFSSKWLLIKFRLRALPYETKSYRKMHKLLFKSGRISLKKKLSDGSDKGTLMYSTLQYYMEYLL